MTQHLNRLAQTEAIVAQVEREIEKRAQRERNNAQLLVVASARHSEPSLTRRAASRVVSSVFPAGL